MFQELMLGVYRDKIIGSAPAFPVRREGRITAALLLPDPPPLTPVDGEAVADVASARRWRTVPGEIDWLVKNGTPWLVR